MEAKPGAGRSIATATVANSTPGGYTMGLVTGAHAISGAAYKKLAYNPTDSFEMVSTLVYCASSSYRGDAPSVTSLLGGDVPVIVDTTVLLAGQIESGAIRGLAVTSPVRTPLLPKVPSAEEAGLKGCDVRTWAGLVVQKARQPTW